MGDCESKSADNGGANLCEMPMKAQKKDSKMKSNRARGSVGEVVGVCTKGGEIRIDLNGGLRE